MHGQANDSKAPSVAPKSQQRPAARRRYEAFIQAELRRLALSDRRTASRLQDVPGRDQGVVMNPAA